MQITLIFVINGEDHAVEEDQHVPLRAVRNRALAESKNTGRPPDEWEVRTEQGGQLLDPERKIMELGLTSGTRLLLTLKMGGGGSHARRSKRMS